MSDLSHYATPDFWKAFKGLEGPIRKQAEIAFAEIKKNPESLRLTFLQNSVVRAKIDGNFRAVGFKIENDFVWALLGDHDFYDRKRKGGLNNDYHKSVEHRKHTLQSSGLLVRGRGNKKLEGMASSSK